MKKIPWQPTLIVAIKNLPSEKKTHANSIHNFYFKIHFQFLGNKNGTGCESDVDDADIADKEEVKLSYVGSDEEDEDYGSSARSPFVKIWCLVTIPQLKA